MAYHQGRGQARQTAAGIRKGEGSDRDLSHPQGTDRIHREAAAVGQGRAPGQAGRAEKELRKALTTPTSPLAPAQFPDLPPIEGVKFATAAAGIRYADRTDVLLALFKEGT